MLVWVARPNIRLYAEASPKSLLPETIPYGERLLLSIPLTAEEAQPITQNEEGVEGKYLPITLAHRTAYLFSGDVSLHPVDSACTSLADWAERFGGRLVSRKRKGCTDEELLWKNCDASPQETILDYENASLHIITHSEVGREVLSLKGGRRIDAFFVGQSCMPVALRSNLAMSKLAKDDKSSFCQAVGERPVYTLKLEKSGAMETTWLVSLTHGYGSMCK